MWCPKGHASIIATQGDVPTRTIPYKQFLHMAKTGDQLLYQGKGIISCLIKVGSQSQYSHCGTVIRMKDGSLYVWESTMPDDTFDLLTLTDKDGPRLIAAEEQLYKYARNNYSVTYRPLKIYDEILKGNLSTNYAQSDMWKVLRMMSKTPYEHNYFELANAHKRWSVGGWGRWFQYNSKRSIFCSELNIYTLDQGMGIPLKDPVSGLMFSPEDFAPEDISWESEGLPFTTPFPLSRKTGEGTRDPRFSTSLDIPGVPEGYVVTSLLGFPMVVSSNNDIDPLLKNHAMSYLHTLDLYKQSHYGSLDIGTEEEQRDIYGRVLSIEELNATLALAQRILDIQTMYKSGKDGFKMLSMDVPDSVIIDFGKNAVVTKKEKE
jgi:hypothetical protein